MPVIGTVATINRYPVKSMQGERPEAVELTGAGIDGDRTWALRDAETGKLVSAKRPRLWQGVLTCTATGTGDDVMVTLPDGTAHGISDPALPIALEALLGRAVTVEASTGPQQGSYESDWPEIDGLTLAGPMDFPTNLTGEGSTFVDVGLLHTLSTTSLATLAAAAPDHVIDADRFRPGILLDTPDLTGYPDNDWTGATMHIGGDGAAITIGDPAPRCIMTTLAQRDLPRDPGVLQVIARENRLANPFGNFACLGSYATVAHTGTIRVGDEITMS